MVQGYQGADSCEENRFLCEKTLLVLNSIRTRGAMTPVPAIGNYYTRYITKKVEVVDDLDDIGTYSSDLGIGKETWERQNAWIKR